MTPLFEWALHSLAAVLAFLIILAAAVVLHRSAQFLRDWLPKPFIWITEGVAWLLFILDVLGFVLLVLPAFWNLVPQEFQMLIRHWIGLDLHRTQA